MNLLQIVNQVQNEIALTASTSVIGNTSQDVIQLLGLVNAVGSELQREFDWEALSKEYRFTTQFLNTTGTWTTSAATVTSIPSTTGLDATYMVTGTGIPQDTYVLTNDSGTQVTLSQTPTVAETGGAIVFSKTKYSIPTDWDRQVNRTHFDKSKHWEMLGPESPQQWQWLKSAYISTGPRIRYRIMGSYFQIWPLLSTAEYLGYEYISKNWVFAVSDTTTPSKSSFSVDTDTCIFNDRLMVLGIKKKYFEIKGFDASYFARDYETQLSIAKANDAGAQTLSYSPRQSSVLVGWENIPDSNYGS